MSSKSIYTVYQVTNTINHKIYIGVHKTDDPYDDYIGSGTLILRAISKHGSINFQKSILFSYDNPTEAYNKEMEIVNEAFVRRTDTYNLKVGGVGGCALVIKEETRRKLSDISKGIKKSKDHSENIRKSKLGSKNPMYGIVPWNKDVFGYSTSKKGQKRKWITNDHQSKQVMRDECVPEGWRAGRHDNGRKITR